MVLVVWIPISNFLHVFLRFLIFYATRTHSVALLQQLGQDARIRQCIAGTPEAHSLFTVVIPHLIALLEGTSPEPVAGLETLFQNQTGYLYLLD